MVPEPPAPPTSNPGAAPLALAPDLVVADRLCGRCRKAFPGDPSLHVAAQADWWICDPCRAILLPKR